MSHFSETALELSKITDPGLFENLAAAVLRRAKPELYANLTQPGVNAEGKAVKSPIDALSFVTGANPPHMVAAHHNTGGQDGLRKKWLHDPSTITPRKTGKPTAPAGDVVKSAAIVKREQERTPNLRVTLALTTNEEPPEDVTRDTEDYARKNGIALDIWSRSRIADYLDHEPEGQWLRKKYLGTEQERLSFDLLRDLSQRSLDVHRPPTQENALIEREITSKLAMQIPRPVGFLVGESGYGKTLAAYQLLQAHVRSGGCGFILPHKVLASAVTLDQAIDAGLRQLHAALAPNLGAVARALCSPSGPLLIVVEDINRSGQSAALIERLANWAATERRENVGEFPWRIVCPVWPQLFGALGDEARKRVGSLGLQLGPYTWAEARAAIQRRASLDGLNVLALEADDVARALGNDPLLIALHDLRSVPNATKVIAGFITQSAERLASSGGKYTAYEYEVGLQRLTLAMLQRRRVDPSWGDIMEWFSNSPDHLAALRELTKHAEVIRISGTGSEARLAFRHDRVQKQLLFAAAIEALKNNDLADEILADPFFAEVIGTALAHESASSANVIRAKASNPLALFYALRVFREPSFDTHQAILEAINQWLSNESSHTRAYRTLRYSALHVLADTQSSHVVGIVRRFRDRSWDGQLACLRNGDLSGGVRLCYALEPGTEALWRDRCIDYSKAKYGDRLGGELPALLHRDQLPEIDRIGALRLAGHFADGRLADAIWACWQSDAERATRVDEYLWALAQCGGERTDALLAPVCDAWAALSDEAENQGSHSPRSAVAVNWLHWAFWRTLPKKALSYFIKRAGSDDNLRSNIMYMLHGVDDPDAVEFVVRELARGLKEIEGTKKCWPFVRSVAEHWERIQRDRGKTMSSESRQRLRTLWQDEIRDKHLRVQSFRIWAAASEPDDLALIRVINPSSVIGDEALRARLKRGDQTAIPTFVEKIREDEHAIWWQYARDIWSQELTEELDAELSRRGAAVERTWGAHHRGDWITADLITRLTPSGAEELLGKHWEHLRFSPNFLQTALYTATPRLLRLVAQAMSECPDKRETLKHIARHFGINVYGHSGVVRVEQVEALIPYLDYLDSMAIHDFWTLCNERGWTTLRKIHLDARLSGEWRNRSGLDDALIMEGLDKELGYERNPWMDLWVDDYLENGVSVEYLFQVVRAWLKTKKSTKALEIAASIVIHAGKRLDAEILLDGVDDSELAPQIVADTRFAVRRRTLA